MKDFKKFKEHLDDLTAKAKADGDTAKLGTLIWFRLAIEKDGMDLWEPEAAWHEVRGILRDAVEDAKQIKEATPEEQGAYKALSDLLEWMDEQPHQKMDYEIQIKEDGLYFVLSDTGKTLYKYSIYLDEDREPYIPLQALIMIQTLKQEGMELEEIIPGIPLELN